MAAGRLGQKSGAGFVTGAAAGRADELGPAIAERYYLGALDEACRCLEEGIGALPDIDVAMQLGAGWSAGPLAWADGEGLPEVSRRLDTLAAEAGPRFTPREPLTTRATSGRKFFDDDKEHTQ